MRPKFDLPVHTRSQEKAKKASTALSVKMMIAYVFWNSQCVIYIDYNLHRVQNDRINAAIRQRIVEKSVQLGKESRPL